MMQDQLEKSKAETQGIMEMKEKVVGILEGLGQAKWAEIDTNGQANDGVNIDDDSDVWWQLEKEFG
jgi:mediator of RNA polymerase II transcription subunit 7